MPTDEPRLTALVYGARAGSGGLGMQAATAAAGLALGGPLVALGPGRTSAWSLPGGVPPNVRWLEASEIGLGWFGRLLRRFRPGRLVLDHDVQLGRWASAQLDQVRPHHLYVFTQVALESLEWARRRGVSTILDNPNGHIRGFARVYRQEWARWVGGRYHGHPTDAMIDRVEREYALADRIRVSSNWAKASLVQHGVAADKVFVCPQPVNPARFVPPTFRPAATGPLRVCYVGSLDLRKGFHYLLQAGRLIGPERVCFEFVGATGDRGSKRLLARERVGLNVRIKPGDPIAAYQSAEVFVLPSLEDGFGFVTAEAMACGLPVIVTDQCGSAEWVHPGETGWVVRAGDAGALAKALETVLARRTELAHMGRAARAAIEARNPDAALRELADVARPQACRAFP